MFEIVLAATDSALQFFQQRIEKLIGFLRSNSPEVQVLFHNTDQSYRTCVRIRWAKALNFGQP